MRKKFHYTNGYTHGGVFHADDVFSTALCILIDSDFQFKRGLDPEHEIDPEVRENTIIYDIGNGEYDHHSLPRETRENGIPYAAFGKLWRDFGYLLCENDEIVKKIDDNFVSKIDAVDNGYGDITSDISNYISMCNPLWDETYTTDRAFDDALNTAYNILERTIMQANSTYRGKKFIEEAIDKMEYNTVVLKKYVNWLETLIPIKEAEFCIYPSLRGGYSLQVVPKELGSREAKFDIPSKYWGSHNLEEVEGMSFCHNTGFLAAFDSITNALNFVKKIKGIK